MNTWILIQVIVDVMAFLGLAVLWVRLRRPPQDDPRLSRGLQLLQSKISVLEDLSDRTDAQVKQLSHLIEQKARLLQNKIIESEHQIQRVDQSMKRSKEVAEIFQDKIPHREIIERQDTIKYVKAAQMAHSGRSVAEIAQEVDLPVGQIELIAKLNKDQLVFDPEALPEWAKVEVARGQSELSETSKVEFAEETLDFTAAAPTEHSHESAGGGNLTDLFQPPAEEYSSLRRLGDEFRSAVAEFERQQQPAPLVPPAITETAAKMATAMENSALVGGAKRVTSKFVGAANGLLNQVEAKAKDLIDAASEPEVKKVVFPKIDVNQNLR